MARKRSKTRNRTGVTFSVDLDKLEHLDRVWDQLGMDKNDWINNMAARFLNEYDIDRVIEELRAQVASMQKQVDELVVEQEAIRREPFLNAEGKIRKMLFDMLSNGKVLDERAREAVVNKVAKEVKLPVQNAASLYDQVRTEIKELYGDDIQRVFEENENKQ